MKILELFKGAGLVGLIANELGWEVYSLDNNIETKPDFWGDIMLWDYRKCPMIPDLIYANPPSSTYYPIAETLEVRSKRGKPKTDEAKLQTAILKRVMRIIKYFKTRNPRLLFVIEAAKGLMRLDPSVISLQFNSTYYCHAGEHHLRMTDFFTNFELKLKRPRALQKYIIQHLPFQMMLTYPNKVIKHIFYDFVKAQQLIN